MPSEQKRYFIELQPENDSVPRFKETELRREQAAQFITSMNEWLKDHDLESKVSAMAITALGQVQIICEADVMSRIRNHEETNIATIRHGAHYVESFNRIATK